MQVYSLTVEDLEGTADTVKAAVLRDLVQEGMLVAEIADMWAANHTLIMRRKTFFRTVTDLWKKIPEDVKNCYWIVVAKKPNEDSSNRLAQTRHLELAKKDGQ